MRKLTGPETLAVQRLLRLMAVGGYPGTAEDYYIVNQHGCGCWLDTPRFLAELESMLECWYCLERTGDAEHRITTLTALATELPEWVVALSDYILDYHGTQAWYECEAGAWEQARE